ncbi:MAG TPA: hypothetical protein VM409_06225, partial [Chloroflexia bacterium]|nr:hypothetical protein [Chloroflexia bacterium]
MQRSTRMQWSNLTRHILSVRMVHPVVRDIVLPAILFMILSGIFLWQPVFTGRVFLPTDILYMHDALWRTSAAPPGGAIAQNQVLSDVAFYYYPYADYAISRLASGHFPLWNPYILTGTPFFASAQAAVLDPVNLVAFLAGPLGYWTLGAWLRLALIGFTTYGAVRALGRSLPAALASGVVFMACGFVTVWLNYSVVTSLTWLPALFWSTTRLVQTGQRVWVAWTALFTGLLLLGGHPEIQFVSGLMVAAYALYTIIVAQPQGLRHTTVTR